MATSTKTGWKFLAALPLTIACLAIGNLLGIIVTALWGWHSVQQGEPGSVAMAFVQGYLGAVLAIAASEHFIGGARVGKFWLKWIVILAAVIYCGMTVLLLYFGDADLVFSWASLAAIVAIIATEIGRRFYDTI
jgi:hypothetical protein